MLQAGIALREISPKKGVGLAGYPHCPRPNEGVHDPLYCGALYLDNGRDRVILVTFDLLFFGKKLCREIRRRIGMEEILFTTSHTHSGPWAATPLASEIAEGIQCDEDYVAFLLDQTEGCIRDAMARPFRAKLGTGVGRCGGEQGIGGNRRAKGGLQDPAVNVLAVKDEKDVVRSVLLNYALHPTYLHAENLLVTADYPGYVRRYLSYCYPEAAFQFAQGASGDQSSRYYRTGQDFEEAARAGTTLGVETYHTVENMTFSEDVEIRFRHREIELPRKSYPPVEEARAAMEKARAAFRAMPGDDYVAKRNAELAMFGAENVFYYAQQAAAGDLRDDELPCEVAAVTLGDTLICATQGEIFVRYDLSVKESSPAKKTFFFELTGGSLPGYLYTPDALEEGGYEVGTSTFAPGAGEAVAAGIRSLME